MVVTVEFIIPKGKPLDLRAPFLRALDEEARLAKRGLELPAKNWAESVVFTNLLKMSIIEWARVITTTNAIYGYNDVGTPAHMIPLSPKTAGALRFFRHGFVAKTKPGRLISGAGSRANKTLIRPKQVSHPGTKARGFSKIVAKNGDERFKRRIQAEVNSELRKWAR